MTHFVRFALAAALLPIFAACAVAVDDEATDPVVVVEDTSAAPAPSPGAAEDAENDTASAGEPVYFGEANALESQSDSSTPPSYTFDLVQDATVTIRLTRKFYEGPKVIGFALFRVTAAEEPVELGRAYGYDGSAEMELYTEHGGTYSLQLLDGLDPNALVLRLSCNSGTCAPRRQPGESCGTDGAMQCDKGLVCLFEAGTCQTPKEPGRCQVAPVDCPNAYEPVCGCDGETWGNQCFAERAGVSLLHSGECK